MIERQVKMQTDRSPCPIRGAAANARYIGMTAAKATHHHLRGTIPTFRAGGTPYATASALHDWMMLRDAHALPDAAKAGLRFYDDQDQSA